MNFNVFELGGVRVYVYGRLRGGRQHFVPSFTSVKIAGDAPPHKTEATWYQAAWFGMCLNVEVPVDQDA